MLIVRIIIFCIGAFIALLTVKSAIRTFVLPRGERDELTRWVFLNLRRIINFGMRRATDYRQKDRIMAWYAPLALMLLLPTWYIVIMVGYTAMFWAVGVTDLYDAVVLSGSSLFTLGFATANNPAQLFLVFTEATIGLLMVALLIAYIPTIYTAFSRREFQVTRFEVRAGSPPSAVEFILRLNRIGLLDDLGEFWQSWEAWFADVEESHTSLAALVFFRSPQIDKSWVTAAGVVLDSAALIRSMVDVPADARIDICIRSGYLCLRRISDFFGIDYNAQPRFPDDPISITREEFDQVYALLAQHGVPLLERDKAWQDFAGWRVNYDRILIELCKLTMAPRAMWSTDRYEYDEGYDALGEIMSRWRED